MDAGYTTISVAQSYLNYNSIIFTSVAIIYAGTFQEELFTFSSTFQKQNSVNFTTCREISNDNKYYNISGKILNLL